MKKINLIFQLFLLPLFFLTIFSAHLFATSHTYVPDPKGTVTPLDASGYTDNIHSSSRNDYVYYFFELDIAGDLTITVNDIDTTDVRFNYSTLDYPSPDWDNGLTTETINGLAQDSFIYLAISSNQGNTAEGYQIVVTLTPTSDSDLSITKTNSADVVTINEDFFYTINVTNESTDLASNIVMIDILPSGLIFNQTETNENSPYWDCSIASGTVTCDHNASGIPAGETHTITLQVTASPSSGDIENNASVSGSINGTAHSDTASEITIISADVDSAENLCYIENTILNYDDAADRDDNCEQTGNFYFGNGCEASVMIVDTNRSDESLSNVIITKMYAPDLDHGTATTSLGVLESTGSDTGGPSTLTIAQFPAYTEGYVVRNIAGFVNDTNFTITDTNTYNNGNKPLTPALYGDYDVSGIHHSGRIFACSGIGEGGIAITSSSDVIDTLLDTIPESSTLAGQYNNSAVPQPTPFDPNDGNIKYIQTMVASTASRDIIGVYLDIDNKATGYVYEGLEDPEDSPFVIIPLWANSDCSVVYDNVEKAGTTDQLVIEVQSGDYSGIGQMTVPSTVRKDARIQMTSVDPNGLSIDAQDCMARSSTSGNFARIAQCANSADHYTDAFGQDAWDRCGTSNGNPCTSQNHGYSCDGDPEDDTCTDYNPIYDNALGCYMCTFNIQPTCSTDNFAIRPERFDANIVETNVPTHYPNLLRSGQDYNTSLIARNADDAISTSYTVLDFDDIVDTPPAKKYFNGPSATPWAEDTSVPALVKGTVPPPTTVNPSHIINGVSRKSVTNGSAEEILGVTFDDVGRVSIYVADVNWSQVDNDDTPMDCNSSEHTYICAELNVTFIPHHFGFAELNITNHAGPDSNFTYIADNRGMPTTNLPTRSPMAARVHTRIEARNKQGGITENFREDGTSPELYYENNISVNQNVKIPATRNLPSEPDAYLFPDANESKIDNKLIGFGRTTGTETDDLGTRNIKWDESTYPLEFNFKRELHKPENPFDVNGTYYSIAATSTYIDPDDGDTAIIDGSRVGDKNASDSAASGTPCIAPPSGSCEHNNSDGNSTFYYGRTRSSELFYKQIRGDSVITPISVDVYCDLGFTVCDGGFGIDTSSGEINEPDWWLSWDHDMDRGDGNVTIEIGTLLEGTGAPKLDNGGGEADRISIDITNDEGVDDNVTVIGYTTSRPMTVPIELVNNVNPASPSYTTTVPYTNSWFIYNKHTDALLQKLPSPFYKVQFVGEAKWTGEGTTGHVMDVNASYKKSQSMDW